jgi:GNAT superfamily N-acetyltransferase
MTDFFCERLSKRHDRGSFDCGIPELNDYLLNRATQDMRRLVAAVFVLVPTDAPSTIAGFYSLSSASIGLNDLPKHAVKKLPRYPRVPAVLIGRLARDQTFPGTGRLLLMDALRRAVSHSDEVAAAMIVVDAMNDAAQQFYEKFGFESALNVAGRLFLPLGTAKKLIGT